MDPTRMTRPSIAVLLAALATLLFGLALALAGIGLPAYSHWLHPVALRGATGLPGAMLFNAGAFLLPGIALVLASRGLRPALAGRGWAARIGLTLVQLSALAFAAQGLLPLEMRTLDTAANRLHALAWMLWWIAFAPGALLLAIAGGCGRVAAAAGAAAALLVPWLAVLAPIGAWVGLAQRLAFLAWFGWWIVAARAFSRSAASVPGSSPPGRT